SPKDPNPKIKKPIATNINPKPYLKTAEGWYFESHSFETVEASAIIKKEFRIENHDTVISETSLVNSLYNIQMAHAQMAPKQTNKIILERAIFFQVAFASIISTTVMMMRGIIVKQVFTILNVVKADPSKLLFT